MCGIVGYIGNNSAKKFLINGLSNLEYRGYDSAGISILSNNNIHTLKTKGRVKDLLLLSNLDKTDGYCGIAHTRWATHGEPSNLNAHPHSNNNNTFSVVHNGIIENYTELKKFLISKNYKFISQTDTEVIPNLIDYYYNTGNDFLHSVYKACKHFKGSYAICVISNIFPDKLIVARKSSPLVLGKGINENFIGSDIPALLEYTKYFYFINDNEYAEVSKDNIIFYDENLNKIEKECKEINIDSSQINKNGYDDYMLKEIYEQPQSISNTINNLNFEHLGITKEYLSNINKIYIIACGTAMHAGLVSKTFIENLCKINVEVDLASEFRYRNPIINSNTLSIFISQSGETADTIAALELAKSYNSQTIAVTNVAESSITRIADKVLYTSAGPEIAVASTKAYTSQITLMSYFSIYLAELLDSCDSHLLEELKNDLTNIPDRIKEILNDVDFKIKNIAKKIYSEKDIYYIGRGLDYYVALEGALKLKEISYIHAEAYASGELKHGAIALIENNSTVVSIVTNPLLIEKSISNIQEVISRGAKTIIITNQNLNKDSFNYIIEIPEINTYLSPILSIIPLQLLAYHIAKFKNLDVDKPRNLAKSVTVE